MNVNPNVNVNLDVNVNSNMDVNIRCRLASFSCVTPCLGRLQSVCEETCQGTFALVEQVLTKHKSMQIFVELFQCIGNFFRCQSIACQVLVAVSTKDGPCLWIVEITQMLQVRIVCLKVSVKLVQLACPLVAPPRLEAPKLTPVTAGRYEPCRCKS